MRTVPTEENNDKLPLRFLPSFDSNVVASNDAMQDTSFPFDSFIRFDQCFFKNIQNLFITFFFARIPVRALRSLRREEALAPRKERQSRSVRATRIRDARLEARREVPLRRVVTRLSIRHAAATKPSRS